MSAEEIKTHRVLLPPIPALLVAVVSIQGGAAFAKRLFPALGPAATSGLRVTLAAALLVLTMRPPVHRWGRSQWAAVVPYGVVLGAMNLSIYLAIARVPLGLAVTLEFLGPLGLAVISSRKLADFLWILLASVGILLLAPGWEAEVSLDLGGILLSVLAGGFWAAYIILGARVSQRLPQGEGVAIGMVFAAATVLPFALVSHPLQKLTLPLLGAGLGVAVLSSALPYYLEMTALSVLPRRTFGILMSLEPAVATLMGFFFLGEQLSVLQWTAVACVSIACAGASRTAPRQLSPLDG